MKKPLSLLQDTNFGFCIEIAIMILATLDRKRTSGEFCMFGKS